MPPLSSFAFLLVYVLLLGLAWARGADLGLRRIGLTRGIASLLFGVLSGGLSLTVPTPEGSAAGWPVWIIGLLGPLLEELLCRGWFYGVLQRRPWLAVLGSTALFMALHLQQPALLPWIGGLGLAWGWLRWRTGSVWPGVLAHIAHNLIVLSILF